MNTIQVIQHISTHPEYKKIVIDGHDEKTPMQSIQWLSSLKCERYPTHDEWRLNGSLEKDTLIVYKS